MISPNISQKSKNLIKMLLDDKKIQFLEGAESEWIDFDSEQHGAVIFQDNDAKFRIRPAEKSYYYARFIDGSRTEMADSQDKAEIVAKGEDKGQFVIEKMVHDVSFNYENTN